MCTIKMEESKLWPQVEQVLGKVRNVDHVLVPQDPILYMVHACLANQLTGDLEREGSERFG